MRCIVPFLACVLLVAVSCTTAQNNKQLPVVLWHGMGDSCCNNHSIGSLANLIREQLGVYVHSIATGTTESKDIWSSYFGSVNDQVAAACDQLASIPELQSGYNALGFSQGGQFMRAVVQRCQHLGPKAHTLITFGAQHQGVMNVPECIDTGNTSSSYCRTMQAIIERGVYVPIIANNVVQAQYYKSPYEMDEYLAHNPFLPDINNEHDTKNPQYASNLASLQRLVLFQFEEDVVVVPKESSWFGVLDPSTGGMLTMEDTPLYKEDWIGLKALDERGALQRVGAPGNHMRFSLRWFSENVVDVYLRNGTSGDVGTEQ